jgi:hypothetical protein
MRSLAPFWLMILVQTGCVWPAPAESLAKLADPRIDEASGIIASRTAPGLFYIHNDSGDSPRVFVVDRLGQTRAVIGLEEATARDYEDIAIAPGGAPDRFDVVVADIGDNNHVRSEVVLYRFAEPQLPDANAPELPTSITAQVTAYRLRYAGGPVDAEALLIHPATGDAYILTKRRDGQPGDIYVLPAPWKSDQVTELERIGSVQLAGATPFQRFITAGDISPDGRRVAVRTYLGGWEWSIPVAQATDPAHFVKIFEQSPKWLVLPPELQGEALTYSHDSRQLLTVSEQLPTYLNEVAVSATSSKAAADKSLHHEERHATETVDGDPPASGHEGTARQ